MGEPVTHKMTLDELRRRLESSIANARVFIEYEQLGGMIEAKDEITDLVRALLEITNDH